MLIAIKDGQIYNEESFLTWRSKLSVKQIQLKHQYRSYVSKF